MVIELSGVQSDLKFNLKSQVWFQTKIFARHKVQIPLYDSHFEIIEFSQYQYLFDPVETKRLSYLKAETKRLSHLKIFVPKTEMMQYRAKRCDLIRHDVSLHVENEWRDLEQRWFRTKNSVIRE